MPSLGLGCTSACLSWELAASFDTVQWLLLWAGHREDARPGLSAQGGQQNCVTTGQWTCRANAEQRTRGTEGAVMWCGVSFVDRCPIWAAVHLLKQERVPWCPAPSRSWGSRGVCGVQPLISVMGQTFCLSRKESFHYSLRGLDIV